MVRELLLQRLLNPFCAGPQRLDLFAFALWTAAWVWAFSTTVVTDQSITVLMVGVVDLATRAGGNPSAAAAEQSRGIATAVPRQEQG